MGCSGWARGGGQGATGERLCAETEDKSCGRTPLHWAGVVKVLLEKGAELESQGQQMVGRRCRRLAGTGTREEYPDTMTNMNNPALIYRHQERWKEAEELEPSDGDDLTVLG